MATLSQLGIPAAGSGILQPKLRHKWQVTFSGLGGNASQSKDLTRQATNVSRPTLEFEEVTIHRYNSIAYVAGKHSWNEISLTVEDDIGGLASSAIQLQLEQQQRLVGASTDSEWLKSAATGSDYKFMTKLELLDGSENVVETWNLYSCFVRSVEYGDLDYSSSDAATITLSLRYDHATQELTSSSLGTALEGNAGS